MTNEQFKAKVDELWTRTKAGELPRDQRFAAINELVEEYIVKHGKRPDVTQVDRLATLCLYEEVTDPRMNKMTADDEPIMSDTQYVRRKKTEREREEIHVGQAHVTGRRKTHYTDNNNVIQSSKSSYYLR